MNTTDNGMMVGRTSEDQAVSGNLFPPVLGLVGIGFVGVCAMWALGP